MLEIIKFIQEHSNWKDLLLSKPYYLRIIENDNLLLFDYSTKSEYNEITKEARGLILEKNTLKVIRYGLRRFDIIMSENDSIGLDVKNLFATEKIDGILVMFYYYDGWHTSTRDTFDAGYVKNNYNDSKVYLPDIIKNAMINQGILFDNMNINHTYVFELVSPEVKIVIPYENNELYFLMCRDNRTLKEVSISYNWLRPERYSFESIENVINFIKDRPWDEIEGLVLEDNNHNRVKIKNKNWVKAHKLKDSINDVFILDSIRNKSKNDVLSYYSEYTEKFNNIESFYNKLLTYAANLDTTYYNCSKKEFAKQVNSEYQDVSMRNLLFLGYDKKAYLFIQSSSSSLLLKKFYKLFK